MLPKVPNYKKEVEVVFSDGDRKVLSLEEVSKYAISKLRDSRLVPDLLKYGFAFRGSLSFYLEDLK